MKLIGINELAQLTGKRRQSIRPVLEAAGIEATPGPHRAKLYPSDRALAVLYTGGDRLDPSQERAALDRVRRERAELDLAREKREVVGIKVAADHWINHLLIARSHLLSLPNQLAFECAADADARMQLRTVADRIVRRVLTELSEAKPLPPNDDA
jgi:hypothetical protein